MRSKFWAKKNWPNIFLEFIDKRVQNDVKRKFRFSFDVVHNLFINKFDKNIWPVFLSLKFANNQFLSLRDSTIASLVSKIQALALLMIDMDFSNSTSPTTVEIEWFYLNLFSVNNMKMYFFLHSIQSIFISIFCIISPRWSSQSSAIIILHLRITNFHSNSDRKDVVQTTSQHRATSIHQNCK